MANKMTYEQLIEELPYLQAEAFKVSTRAILDITKDQSITNIIAVLNAIYCLGAEHALMYQKIKMESDATAKEAIHAAIESSKKI